MALLVFLGSMEVALRLAPWVVPVNMLYHFEPGLRSKIAQGRYSTVEDTVPVMRDDGGPALWTWKPHYAKRYHFDDYGAVGLVRADERGFCNPPDMIGADQHVDIVAVGDSFTWCHAVRAEDAWPLRLGKLTGLSAYNLGRGGIGLYEYLQFLKSFGLRHTPRVVVMNICEANDLRDAQQYKELRLHGSAAEETDGSEGLVARGSHAFNLLRAVWRETKRWRTGSREWEELRERRQEDRDDINFRFSVLGDAGPIAFNARNSNRDEVQFARMAQTGEVFFDLFDDALKNFVELAAEAGFVPVVAYSPQAHVVYADRVRFEDPGIASTMMWFSKAQRAYFAKKAGELGYRFVDLTPALAAAVEDRIDEKSLLYYPSSVHYTSRAHAVAALALAREIDAALSD